MSSALPAGRGGRSRWTEAERETEETRGREGEREADETGCCRLWDALTHHRATAAGRGQSIPPSFSPGEQGCFFQLLKPYKTPCIIEQNQSRGIAEIYCIYDTGRASREESAAWKRTDRFSTSGSTSDRFSTSDSDHGSNGGGRSSARWVRTLTGVYLVRCRCERVRLLVLASGLLMFTKYRVIHDTWLSSISVIRRQCFICFSFLSEFYLLVFQNNGSTGVLREASSAKKKKNTRVKVNGFVQRVTFLLEKTTCLGTRPASILELV